MAPGVRLLNVQATPFLPIPYNLDTTMDDSLLLAFKMLGGLVGFAIGAGIGSLLGAIWLRLAASWLNFSDIPYWNAFRCSLVSGLVVASINLAVGFNHGLSFRLLADDSFQMNSLPFQYGPTFFLYSIIFGLMLTAVIFRRIIQAKSDNQLMAFGDAVSLASLYYTISFFAFAICGAVVCLAIAILLSFIGA